MPATAPDSCCHAGLRAGIAFNCVRWPRNGVRGDSKCKRVSEAAAFVIPPFSCHAGLCAGTAFNCVRWPRNKCGVTANASV